MVDMLVSKANTNITMGTSSWKEQFVEAITVTAGKWETPQIRSYVSFRPYSLVIDH